MFCFLQGLNLGAKIISFRMEYLLAVIMILEGNLCYKRETRWGERLSFGTLFEIITQVFIKWKKGTGSVRRLNRGDSPILSLVGNFYTLLSI